MIKTEFESNNAQSEIFFNVNVQRMEFGAKLRFEAKLFSITKELFSKSLVLHGQNKKNQFLQEVMVPQRINQAT
jgi:hypothetical protein